MRITFPPCPPGILSSLRGAGPAMALFTDLRGLGLNVTSGRIEAGEPHRVYYIPPREMLRSRSLDTARALAWRMSHMAGGMPFSTEVDLFANPRNEQITMVNRGPYAGAPSRQIPQLLASATEGDFELRMLRIPEIKLMAIWLHSPRLDIVVPVAPVTPPLDGAREYGIDDLLHALAPVIARLDRVSQDEDQ